MINSYSKAKDYKEEKLKEEEKRKGKQDPSNFVLVCKGCSVELVPATDMVQLNHHHIVIDFETFRGKMRTVPIPPEDQLSFATESYICTLKLPSRF